MITDQSIRATETTRISLAQPIFDEEMKEAAIQAFQNERFVGGESVHKFEEELGLEGYAMSRLLAKLELHRHIIRRREGTDKIVSLRNER
jgi:hypothetical protein